MRDKARIARIIAKLHRVWSEYGSDQRLGQLITNLCPADNRQTDLFYVEDDGWERALDYELSLLDGPRKAKP